MARNPAHARNFGAYADKAAPQANAKPPPHAPEAKPADVADKISQLRVGNNSGLSIADFELLKVVGKGSFAKVMQVRKVDSNEIYAMKVLKKDKIVKRKKVKHTNTERRILEDIEHPFIVSLRFAFQNKEKLYLILDYFNGGELFFHLKECGRFDEERARFYGAEIALALECLHSHDIIYRDLKPENVLLDYEGHIRLTDFGLSKDGINIRNRTTTFCGTPEYLAPEVVRGEPYGKPVDWWSLGCLMYEMLTGWPPFTDDSRKRLYRKIKDTEPDYPKYLSASSSTLIWDLLRKDPLRRCGSRIKKAAAIAAAEAAALGRVVLPDGAVEGDEADPKWQGTGDFPQQVMNHQFFASLDFDKLFRKAYRAPFIPTITKGLLDVGNVDREFKEETPRDTPVMGSALSVADNGNAHHNKALFDGFTYAGPTSALADIEPDSDDEAGMLEPPHLSDSDDEAV